MKKLCKILANVLIGTLLVFVLVLVVPRFFGVKMFSVLSGSMEPAYSVGDLIYAVPTDAEKIQEGDPISFLLNDSGTVATHRVVEADRENQQFYTKGDANELSDGNPVNYKNVIGVVKFSIPVIGYLIGYMGTTPGKIITVTILGALIILILLLQRQGEEDEEEYEEEEEEPSSRRQRARKEKQEERQRERGRRMREPVQAEPQARDSPERETYVPNARIEQPDKKVRSAELKESEKVETKREEQRPEEKEQEYFTYVRPEKRGRQKESFFREKERMLPFQQKEKQTKLRHSEDDGGSYEYERLQICWKMIAFMERMWNEAISPARKYGEEEPSEVWHGEPGLVEWLDEEEEEEGGMDDGPSGAKTPMQKISEKKKKTSA